MASSPNQLIGIATTLQNKVGTALTSAQTLLPAPEYASAVMQAGATGMVANVLISLKQGQEHLLKLTSKVSGLLQAQVDASEEMARLEADRLAEELKEKGLTGGAGGTDDKDKLDMDSAGGGFGAWFTKLLEMAGLPLLTAGGAALFFKSFGKKLIKGGFYGFIASQLAKPLINFVEDGILKVEIPESDEKILEDAIVGAVIAGSIFGPTGALVALVAVGLKSIYDTLTDPDKSIKDISMTQWLTTLVPAVTIVGMKYATIGGMIAAAPYVFAVAIAAGIGLGLKWLYDKSQEIQDEYLDQLQDLTGESEAEFKKRLRESKKGWKERWLGEHIAMLIDSDSLSLEGKMGQAADQGIDRMRKIEKAGGNVMEALSEKDAVGLKEVADWMMNYSDQEIKDIVLNDKAKMIDIMRTMNNIRDLAAAGVFGEADSKAIFQGVVNFNDRLKDVANEMIASGGELPHGAIKNVAVGARLSGVNGPIHMQEYQIDVLGKIGELEKKIEEKQAWLNSLTEDSIAKKKAELEDAKSRDDSWFFDNDEVDRLQAELKIMENEFKMKNLGIPGITQTQIDILKKQLSEGQMFSSTNLSWEKLRALFSEQELKDMIKKSLLPPKDFKNIEKEVEQKEFPFLSHTLNSSSKKFNSVNLADGVAWVAPDGYLSKSTG